MEKLELYRESASECLALAQQTAEPDDRVLLIGMATRLIENARERRQRKSGQATAVGIGASAQVASQRRYEQGQRLQASSPQNSCVTASK